METEMIRVENIEGMNDQEINLLLGRAISLLRDGETVAFPTETVYGLGANALSDEACQKIYTAKMRPSDNPLIVHISDEDMLRDLTDDISDRARLVMDRFWPGPLTILFPKSDLVSEVISRGQPSVAVRMPNHPVARKLIELCKVPIAAPSANLSGRPSPTTADHVYQDLKGRIPCIIDGGYCDVGVESTVIDLQRNLILRPGGITLEDLRELIPEMELYSIDQDPDNLIEKPPTPGMKYRHYSPDAKVILLEFEDQSLVESEFLSLIQSLKEEGIEKIGIIHTMNDIFTLPNWIKEDLNIYPIILGDTQNLSEIARGLFRSLRDLESQNVSVIIMQGVTNTNEGAAIMNRIRKASSTIIKL